MREVSWAAAFTVATSHSSHTHSVFYLSASFGSFVTVISLFSVGLGKDGMGRRAGSFTVFQGADVSLFPVTMEVSGTQLAINKLLIECMNDQINTLIQVIKVFLSGKIFGSD